MADREARDDGLLADDGEDGSEAPGEVTTDCAAEPPTTPASALVAGGEVACDDGEEGVGDEIQVLELVVGRTHSDFSLSLPDTNPLLLPLCEMFATETPPSRLSLLLVGDDGSTVARPDTPLAGRPDRAPTRTGGVLERDRPTVMPPPPPAPPSVAAPLELPVLPVLRLLLCRSESVTPILLR